MEVIAAASFVILFILWVAPAQEIPEEIIPVVLPGGNPRT